MIQRPTYIEKLNEYKDTDFIKILKGVKRCGKSTLLKLYNESLINEGINEEDIIYIDFEDVKYNTIKNNIDLINHIYNILKEDTKKKYLLLDNLHHIVNWESSIKNFQTIPEFDIYITNSNFNILQSQLSADLIDKCIEIDVYPLSYNEVLAYKLTQKSLSYKNMIKAYENEVLEEYIQYGGMPFIQKLNDEDKYPALDDTLCSILYKNIVEDNKIREISLFNDVVKLLLQKVGSNLTSNKISGILEENNIHLSANSTRKFIEFLEEFYLFENVERMDINSDEVLKFSEKIYPVDHGFCQLVNTDENKIIETIVYIELVRRGYNVNVGRINNKEVDFICSFNNRKFYIQVTGYISDEEEFKPLEKIRDNYPKYVISMDEKDLSRNGIIHLNLKKFLKEGLC